MTNKDPYTIGGSYNGETKLSLLWYLAYAEINGELLKPELLPQNDLGLSAEEIMTRDWKVNPPSCKNPELLARYQQGKQLQQRAVFQPQKPQNTPFHRCKHFHTTEKVKAKPGDQCNLRHPACPNCVHFEAVDNYREISLDLQKQIKAEQERVMELYPQHSRLPSLLCALVEEREKNKTILFVEPIKN